MPRKPAKPKPARKPAAAPSPGSSPASAWTPAAIRALRERLGLTLKQAAAAVGVTLRAWQSWEANERIPSGQSLILLDLLASGRIDLPKKKTD